MTVIIDLVLVAILAVSGWSGYRKGFILGLSGVLALIIAFYGANLVAETYSSEFTVILEPFVSGLVDKAVDDAAEKVEETDYQGNDETEGMKNKKVYDVSFESLRKLGILKTAAENISNEISESVTEVGQNLKNTLVKKLCSTIAYVITLIVVFILILIVITVIANILNLAFKLPGLELINDILGTALGLLKGLILVFVIAWVLRFTGFLLSEERIDNTFVLKWLIAYNPITAILGL
ncbi:MAG: CvpA family protein [Clostridiales bacterium]|nr:CvpA family protein [Clostridiales bacterium]